jgi:hypothetical protein
MIEAGTRDPQAAILERGSRVRRTQRAERILGLVLWIGFAAAVLFCSRL